MSLSGKTLANTYKDLLQVDNSNSGVDGVTRRIKDGEGTISSVSISDDIFGVQPVNDDTSTAFLVNTNGGTTVFHVDTTNQLVSASGNYVNTQYATFSIGYSETATFVDDTHHPIPFSSANYGSNANVPDLFGTGTDPATTFTTADSTKDRASDLVPCLWYINDDISIDAIKSIEGADTATGDTTRMHLFSYDFTSGATACLTNGTLLGHNSDVTNAGGEQPYLSSWTVDSAAVTAGKVILAFFKSDSVNSDYSLQVTIKYHLT